MGVSQYTRLNRQVSAAAVDVTRDGTHLGTMTSEQRQYIDSFGNPTFEPATEVAIHSDLREDLYLVYGGSVGGTEQAIFTVIVNPLVSWFWIGCGVLIVGGLITMWPGGPQLKTVRRRAVAQSGYAVPLAGAGE